MPDDVLQLASTSRRSSGPTERLEQLILLRKPAAPSVRVISTEAKPTAWTAFFVFSVRRPMMLHGGHYRLLAFE